LWTTDRVDEQAHSAAADSTGWSGSDAASLQRALEEALRTAAPQRTQGEAPQQRHRSARVAAEASVSLQRGGGAEPRFFAFLWGVFLLAAAAMTVFRGAGLGMFEPATARPAVAALLEMTALGVCALWPMVRLSQAAPSSPLGSAWADLLVLVVPAQGVIWPMVVQAQWPLSVGAGLAALLASWGALVGSIVAAGSARDQPHARTGWMVLTLTLTAGAPALMALGLWAGTPLPQAAALASPYTAILALTSAPSGWSPRMSQEEWLAALAPAVVSVPLWVLAALRSRRPMRRHS